MNIIAVDIGNSATKISTSPDASLITIDDDDDQTLPTVDSVNHHWVIISVDADKTQRLAQQIEHRHRADKISVISNDQIPIASSVKKRASVGTDRLMAAYAATQLNHSRGRSLVIVDAGTAVTIDLVTAAQTADQGVQGFDPQHGVFRGGLIFPGIVTSLKSLSDNTAALPDLTHSILPGVETEITIGDETVSAILNGVAQSQTHAILSIAGALATQHNANVICTGGGMKLMPSLIPAHWQWVPDLIHQGCRHLTQRT